jgi:hypothetical protein
LRLRGRDDFFERRTFPDSGNPVSPTAMKIHREFLTAALLFASVPALLHAAAPRDVVVIDFTSMPRNDDGTRQRGYEYSFGDWDDRSGRAVGQIFEKGLLVNLAGSKGGVGENRGLDFRKHTRARIDYMIGDRNRAEAFAFTLVDTDGTDQSWEVPLKGQPVGVPLSTTLDLTKPSREEKPGKKPGLNLPKLDVWQLKGNYGDEPLEVLVIKVTAVSG